MRRALEALAAAPAISLARKGEPERLNQPDLPVAADRTDPRQCPETRYGLAQLLASYPTASDPQMQRIGRLWHESASER